MYWTFIDVLVLEYYPNKYKLYKSSINKSDETYINKGENSKKIILQFNEKSDNSVANMNFVNWTIAFAWADHNSVALEIQQFFHSFIDVI